MSVDVVFQPKLPTVLITTAAQAVSPGSAMTGMMSFRVVNLSATAGFYRIGYGPTAAQATANAGAATSGGKGVITMIANSVESFEFPVTTFFASESANTTGFEFTPGQGA